MLARLFVLLLCGFTFPLIAATFTVTNGGDSGAGTLRQAILDANATPGRDQIVLATDVMVDSSLPAITDPIDISGARMPSGRYRIGSAFIDGITRLRFAAGSATSTVDSIWFTGYVNAISIQTTGVTVTNSIVDESTIVVIGSDNVIGGTGASDGNSIDFFTVFGDRTLILGNDISNFMMLSAADARVGSAAAGNTIHGGISIQQSPGVIVEGNTITGTVYVLQTVPGTGPTILGNGITASGDAIRFTNTPSGAVRDNTINAARGVIVLSSSTSIEITGNSIIATGLAIDLGEDGATPNDPAPDADTGANALQNFPVLTSAVLTPGSLTVSGTLTSAPLTPYQIELFSNDAANPDARTRVDSFTATTDATGNLTFTRTITTPLPVAGEVITATATNRGLIAIPGSSPNSTSEVSEPIALALPGGLGFESATYTVDEDDGTVTITVTRTGGDEGTVTVNYATTDGSATAPADYTETSGTLTFGPGVTEQTFTVPILQDMVPEANESFTITLSGPTGGATLVNATTTVNITGSAIGAAAIPTASEWGLIALTMALALFAASALRQTASL